MLTLVLIAGMGADILHCVPGRHAELVVSKQQWIYIHTELWSWDSKRVNALIHPKRGVSVRVVDTAFAEDHGYRLSVGWTHWTRRDIEKKLQGIDLAKFGHMYDVNYPGYTFGEISHLSPVKVEFNSKNVEEANEHPATMKGNMLYMPEIQPVPVPDKKHPSLIRDFKRLAPLTYIKMRCIDGRLWLDEVGSDTARE